MRANVQNNDSYCEEFLTLEAALKADGAKSDEASLTAGLNSLGTSYSSALILGGFHPLFGASTKDAPAMFATFAGNAACSCYAYTSGPQPLA